LIELIVNRGRSFMYSTAPVPAAVESAIASIDLLQADSELQHRIGARQKLDIPSHAKYLDVVTTMEVAEKFRAAGAAGRGRPPLTRS
jgi:7-keto-8-aminopelargonate synthetase-like enzyme